MVIGSESLRTLTATALLRGFLMAAALSFTSLAFASLAMAQDDDAGTMDAAPENEPGEYDEPPLDEPFDEPPMDEPPIDEPMDEPPIDEPPPMDDPPPVDDPPPMDQDPVEEPIERDPPPPPDDTSGPRPDPNYGQDTGDSALVPVDPETQKNRKVIRTVPRKEYSKAEKNAFCGEYEDRLISYYSDIYKVQNCERRRIMNNKTVYGLMRAGKKIVTVSQDVIAALREGEPLDRALSQQSARSCKVLEGDYVTFSNVDVYYVEKCKKRMLPDWETYLEHRKSHRKSKTSHIISLSFEEFSALKEGEEIGSIIDAAYDKLLDGTAGVDVIPVDEACAGVNGKIASYYSRLYRIEKCMKREISDPATYFKATGGTGKYVELSSEQWLSLPDGVPINNDRDLTNPNG